MSRVEGDTDTVAWLRGDYTVIEHNPAKHPRTATVKAGANLELHGAEAGTSLTVHTEAERLCVSGQVQGGSRLTVSGNRLRNIEIQTTFATLFVNEAASGRVTLVLPAALSELHLCPGTWRLKEGHGNDVRPDPLTLHSATPASISSNDRKFIRVEATGGQPCEVDLPADVRATVTADGDVKLVSLAEGSQVKAGSIEVSSNVTGSEECPAVLESSGDITIHKSVKQVRLNADGRVNIRGRLEHASVQCSHLVVGEAISDAHVTAMGQDASGNAVTVGSTPTFNEPSYSNMSNNPYPAWEPDFSRWNVSHGRINGTELQVPAQANISARHLEDVTVHQAGAVFCETLSSSSGSITANTLYAKELRADASNLHVDKLTCQHLYANGALIVSTLHCQKATAHAHNQDDVQKLTLRADTLHCHGTEGDVDVSSQRHLHLRLNDNGTATAAVRGTAWLEGGTVRHLTVLPPREDQPADETADGVAGSGTNIVVQTAIERVAIDGKATLDVDKSATIDGIEVCAALKLVTAEAHEPKMALSNASELTVRIEDTKRAPSLTTEMRLNTESHVKFVKRGQKSEYLSVGVTTGGEEETDSINLHISGGSTVHLHAPAREVPNDAPAVDLSGKVQLKVSGTLRSLDSRPVNHATPLLVPQDDQTIVHGAAGRLRIPAPMNGVVFGRGRARNRPEDWLTIVEIQSSDNKNAARSGKLIDVDLTQLDLASLDKLNSIDVLDPTPCSLRRFAKVRSDARAAATRRAELRTRAEKATRIQEALADRAVPGSSRAASQWAISRLHHRALPRGWEWTLRWFYRAVGYAQHPGVALITWISAILTVTALQVFLLLDDAKFLSTLQVTFLNSLIIPRFTIESADKAFQQLNELVQVGFMVALTLPFVYLILSVKNYLASPGIDSVAVDR